MTETLDKRIPMPNDTTPPPPAPETEPTLPVELVIPRGKARLYLAGALLDMHRAIANLEATAAAVARALDQVQP
jgi:hypothetical protein